MMMYMENKMTASQTRMTMAVILQCMKCKLSVIEIKKWCIILDQENDIKLTKWVLVN